ncbi:hypothetical protein BDD12DRAFT_891434 [Trichophaea hybrida]|nr:hypothetical protein BDD12DRAFT_891434 [Trichophaea hybrida]
MIPAVRRWTSPDWTDPGLSPTPDWTSPAKNWTEPYPRPGPSGLVESLVKPNLDSMLGWL